MTQFSLLAVGVILLTAKFITASDIETKSIHLEAYYESGERTDETTENAITTTLSPLINQTLSPTSQFAYTFNKEWNNPMKSIYIQAPEGKYNYKFSLSLLWFSCRGQKEPPKLDVYDLSKTEITRIASWTWPCSEVTSKDSALSMPTEYLHNLKSVKIIPNGEWLDDAYAHIVAEVYLEMEGKTCPSGMFSCDQDSQNGDCDSYYNSQGVWGRMFDLPNNNKQNSAPSRDSWKGHHYRSHSKNHLICIPHEFVCDDFPSCNVIRGSKKTSLDESDPVCQRCEDYLDWAFIITRSIAAIVFVLIPTLIIFFLFYRRQMAMHRARLLREVEMARRRRAFSLDAVGVSDARFANDLPPTYDDVYETKDPPPCFCHAVYIESIKSANTGKLGDASCSSTSISIIGNEGVDNPAFECVCKSPEKS